MRYYTFTYSPQSISNRTIFSLGYDEKVYRSYDEIKVDMNTDLEEGHYSLPDRLYFSDWLNNEDLENQSINSAALKSSENNNILSYKIVIREDHPAFNFEEFVLNFKSLKDSSLTVDRRLELAGELKDNVLERLLLEVDVV